MNEISNTTTNNLPTDLPVTQEPATPSLLDRSPLEFLHINIETIIFIIILSLAFITRFYGLGDRVISHDENSHVYFSWLLEQGKAYKHDPVTHGPLQFHLIALSYFIFGDNDLTARLPAAIFSIATIAFMWAYRDILGRVGRIIAAIFLLISPYVLYYGRYARNEAFVGLFGVVMIWSILKYLKGGEPRYLIWLTIANALHFTAKETSFIYAAQALLFLGLLLLIQLFQVEWPINKLKKIFKILILLGLLLVLIGFSFTIYKPDFLVTGAGEAGITTPVDNQDSPLIFAQIPQLFLYISLAGIIIMITSLPVLYIGYTLKNLRENRIFDLIVVLATMILPMLAPFPVRFFGRNPIDYTDTNTIIFVAVFIILLAILATVIGVLWKPRLWLINASIFYSIFIIFYTTLFTNGFGFFTGLVGSLGYWLEQQGVNRGSQPIYYYALIQIPIYEYLTAFGSLAAIIYGIKRFVINGNENPDDIKPIDQEESNNFGFSFQKLSFLFLVYWTFSSLLAYTIAGEKMPWLTFHIALPMALLSAWFVGTIIKNTDWKIFKEKHNYIVLLLFPVILFAISGAAGVLFGTTPPFQGNELYQLESTSTFLTSLLIILFFSWLLLRYLRNWSFTQIMNTAILELMLIGAFLTSRTAFMAAYLNYDDAIEYLVYAHSARGVKTALAQIEEISLRTTSSMDIHVAYDNDTTYPYWWYLRNYPNQHYYSDAPTRELRDVPIILVGDDNYGKIEPVVGQAYYQFDYIRLWWPNQDYFDLTWQGVINSVSDPQMREALFRIWFYRDFSLYGQVTNKDMSSANWYPSDRMRLYIRKDLVNKLWNYGTVASEEIIIADPYEGKQLELTADIIIGAQGNQPGEFMHPRDIEVAPDGSIYIADSENNRIQHIDRNGNVIDVWGTYADIASGYAPGGTFNQPWGIAIDQDQSVYVADTWNHRIQKFSTNGEFIKMWGSFGQAETPDAFWGPRDVEIDQNGNIIVSDTGNKRIVIFDAEGNYINQFGSVGMDTGQFDEPVGIAIGPENQLFVADTWNQRIQTFMLTPSYEYLPLREWEISGWYGQSLDNKPYLAANDELLFVVDPEGYRILTFNLLGEFVSYIGNYSIGADGFGLPTSVSIDPIGGIWVSDSGNHRLMHFTIP